MKRFQYRGERVVSSGYGSGEEDPRLWWGISEMLHDRSVSDYGYGGSSLSQSGSDNVKDRTDYYSFQEAFQDHYSLLESGGDEDYPPGISVSLPGEWPD